MARISVELPGIEAKDIEVFISDNALVIKTEKKDEREEAQNYVRERECGSFERFIEMPTGVGTIEAEFANGVLIIQLLKTSEAMKRKKILIRG